MSYRYKIADKQLIIDSALSSTSTNPVQNKVINSKFNSYYTKTEVDNKVNNISVPSAVVTSGYEVSVDYDEVTVTNNNSFAIYAIVYGSSDSHSINRMSRMLISAYSSNTVAPGRYGPAGFLIAFRA